MGVSKLVLVAAAALGLGLPAAEAQNVDELAVESAQGRGALKPWKNVRGFGRVLDLSKFPVVIDEPGLYAIDRNWRIPPAATAATLELIRITASGVTLDLHEFQILADVGGASGSAVTLLVITGSGAEIRNGGLFACCEGIFTLRSTGVGTKLHHLSVGVHESMTFDADHASLSDSTIEVRVAVRLAGRSDVQRNTISCNRGQHCIRLLGDGNQVTDNNVSLGQGGGIGILGHRNVVANNVIDAIADDPSDAFVVEGDHNVVRNNTVLVSDRLRSVVRISGTANTLDGNIGAPGVPVPGVPRMQARVGMEFTADGNFYGDNRMAAEVPFALGGTVQTDWGGNVGY